MNPTSNAVIVISFEFHRLTIRIGDLVLKDVKESVFYRFKAHLFELWRQHKASCWLHQAGTMYWYYGGLQG